MTCPVFNNLRKRYTQSMYMYNIFHQADFYHKHIKVYFLNKVFLKIESSLITRNTYIVYASEKSNYKVIMQN